MSQHESNNANDLSGSRHIQFGEFNDSSNPQNALTGANITAGTPAFNNVSGPGFSGPFGDGSNPSPANNQNAPIGAIPNTGAPAFPVIAGPGFAGPTGGGTQSGFFPNNNSQFGLAPNFGSPFHGSNNYVAPGTSYPFQQQMQTTTPFANFGYPTPMMTAPGMSSSVPTTPLRITVGNLITHSDNCTMCMGYVAHLITASDFNKVISERDGLIKGATTSSTNPQGHELVVNSLQEQIASTLRSHETERQTLNDRITALELERNELRTRHESDVAQLDEIIRDCQEANERRLYWKDQYYDLRDHGDRYNAEARAEASQTKSLDKGKGREVPIVPLQSRIASIEQRVASGSSVPLSQRLTPTEGEINTPRKVDEKRAARTEPAQGRFEEAPAEPLVSSTTRITPNMGEKRKREAAGQPPNPRALVSYDDLHDNSGEPTYSYKAYQMEHYLTDMEDDDSEPEAHPNRLKGKQREMQNKINRESRRRMDASAAQRAQEEGRSPPPKRTKGSKNKEYDALRGTVTRLPFQAPVSAEEVETIVKALNESDNVRPLRPMWKTVHGMIAMHKQARQVPRAARTAMQDTVIDKFIAVPRWFATEMNRQGRPLPHLFEPRASQKEAKGFTMGDIMPNEAGPSNVAHNSAAIDTGNDSVIPTVARGTRIAQSPTVLASRVWHGCRENDPVAKWAESILGSPASERLNGMLVESNQDTPVTNTRSICGMVAVYRLLPNNEGNNVLSDNESNLIVHLLLCELALDPTRYDGILQSMGLLPHPNFQPGPLPDYSHDSPPTVRQVAHELAIRGYTKSQLQDIALYLLWWLHGVAPTIASCWIVIQRQFVHVVLDVLAHHVFQGVPRTTVDVENYVFPDSSQSSNIDNAGRYADYSVVLTYVRPFAQQLSAQGNELPVAGAVATQSVASPSTEGHAIEMAPRIIDWDDTQFNATGDPVIDYGEDDGMDMAGYTQPQV
ncbi:hypothetical protein GGU10DRAFT_380286 [Lentinula aff. detonsa]|uniref:Uncharacterized protein n=1 Tax=Lentinula aff. detonsa TaxID=2804958 RepID=A0AA38KTM8_9AGAR|nr:hypothetical protein GGU10DRAFT_380286 [Lentinula aff. detonsa]